MLARAEDRKRLALTLKDTKSIVSKLEDVLATLLHLLFVIFYLLVFGVRAWRARLDAQPAAQLMTELMTTTTTITMSLVCDRTLRHPPHYHTLRHTTRPCCCTHVTPRFLTYKFIILIIHRLQVDLYATWLSFSSVFLAFAFVFGNSIRNVYESIIYLFVVHPFDVKDVLLLQNGDQVEVRPSRALYMTCIVTCNLLILS